MKKKSKAKTRKGKGMKKGKKPAYGKTAGKKC